MARANVTHSKDAVKIKFMGNPSRPEPTTGIIEFPGGHVEVARCSDGSYWAHLRLGNERQTIDSRIDVDFSAYSDGIKVESLPNERHITGLSVRVKSETKEN